MTPECTKAWLNYKEWVNTEAAGTQAAFEEGWNAASGEGCGASKIEWRAIETAPKDKLIMLGGVGWINEGRWLGLPYEYWWDPNRGVMLDPTHWILLPEPPQ